MGVILKDISYLDNTLSEFLNVEALACVCDTGKPVGKNGRICYFCTDGIRLSIRLIVSYQTSLT